MKRIGLILLLSAFLLAAVPAGAEDIQWFALEKNVAPAGNPVQFSVDDVWRTQEAEGVLVYAYVTYCTQQANVQIHLHDFVLMTRQNDVYEAALASTVDGTIFLTEEAPMTLPPHAAGFTIWYTFAVPDGADQFVLVYRNSPQGNFYATDVFFPPLPKRQASAPNTTAVPEPFAWTADSFDPFGDSGDWLNGALGDIALPGLSDVLIPSADTPPREVHIPCFSCHGSKKCKFCNGSGTAPGMYGTGPSPCSICNQSGICDSCGGLGYYVQYE